jgi:predicted Zn-dependent peptidase
MRALPLLLLVFAHIAAAAAMPRKIVTYEGVSEWRLDNGLRLLLVPDRALPTVTVSIHYDVGSAVEGSGDAGLAHLFEHMLFKGTSKHDNLWSELQARGAQMNDDLASDERIGHALLDEALVDRTLAASDERNRHIDSLSSADVRAALARHLTASGLAEIRSGDFKP